MITTRITIVPAVPAVPSVEAVEAVEAWVEPAGEWLDQLDSSDQWISAARIYISAEDGELHAGARFGERISVAGEPLGTWWGHMCPEKKARYADVSARHESRQVARLMADDKASAELGRLRAAVELRAAAAAQTL